RSGRAGAGTRAPPRRRARRRPRWPGCARRGPSASARRLSGCPRRAGCTSLPPFVLLPRTRKRERERRAGVHRSLRPGPSAVLLDDPPDAGQPDAGPLDIFRAVEPLEDAEELAGVLPVEAHAVVPHDADDLVRRGACRCDLDLRDSAPARVLDGVGKKVDEHLAQERGVAADRRQLAHGPADLPALPVLLDLADRVPG